MLLFSWILCVKWRADSRWEEDRIGAYALIMMDLGVMGGGDRGVE